VFVIIILWVDFSREKKECPLVSQVEKVDQRGANFLGLSHITLMTYSAGQLSYMLSESHFMLYLGMS
jgi:hypothetical protein